MSGLTDMARAGTSLFALHARCAELGIADFARDASSFLHASGGVV